MKKFAILFLLTLSALLLVSCNTEQTDNDVLQNLESVVKQTTAEADDQFAYQKDLASWYTPEVDYKYDPHGDNSEGIEWLTRKEFNSYSIKDDRMFFRTKRFYTINGYHEDKMISYIDIKTGEKNYLCPNPLCSHYAEDGCLLVDVSDYYIIDNLLYTIKNLQRGINVYETIVEIDLEQNTMRELYQCTDIYDYVWFTSLKNNVIYFSYSKETERTDDGNGNIITKEEITKMYLDLATEKVGILKNNEDKYDTYYKIYESDTYIYWWDSINCDILVTDIEHKNEITVLNYESDYSLSSASYDSNTGELYLCISSDDMIREDLDHLDTEDGAIYVIDKENNVRKLEMPTEKITGFQLTNNYIYYTTYDPKDFGYTAFGYPCMMQDGGKIYRVSREDTTSPELVFDAKGELFPGAYIVFGDYLYIDYNELVQGADYANFRRTGSTARIHIEDQTIKWLNFD